MVVDVEGGDDQDHSPHNMQQEGIMEEREEEVRMLMLRVGMTKLRI